MNRIRVALVEDDPVIRTITADYLGQQLELRCEFVVASAEEFMSQLDLQLPPQVVVLDIGLPGMSGLEAISHIISRIPAAHILMRTVLEEADTIYQALCQGALGYVLKSMPLPELKAAVLEVMQGGTPFSRSVSRKVLAHFKPTPLKNSDVLTAREQQVLRGLVDGLTTKQVAIRLDIGVESVRTYIRNIYDKLHVSSRPELLSRAVRGYL